LAVLAAVGLALDAVMEPETLSVGVVEQPARTSPAPNTVAQISDRRKRQDGVARSDFVN
jgi:hypothetical protein